MSGIERPNYFAPAGDRSCRGETYDTAACPTILFYSSPVQATDGIFNMTIVKLNRTA